MKSQQQANQVHCSQSLPTLSFCREWSTEYPPACQESWCSWTTSLLIPRHPERGTHLPQAAPLPPRQWFSSSKLSLLPQLERDTWHCLYFNANLFSQKEEPKQMWTIWQGCSSFVSKCKRLVGRILNITLVIHKHFIFQERRGGKGCIL